MPPALRTAPKNEAPAAAGGGDRQRARTNNGALAILASPNDDGDELMVVGEGGAEASTRRKQRPRRKRATIPPGQQAQYQPQTPDVKLMTLLLKSHLSLHQRLREVEGILLDVGLGDSALEIWQVLKTAANNYDTTVKAEGKGHKRGPPAIYGYMALMAFLASTEKAGLATMQAAAGHKQEDEALSVEDLCEKVMVCKAARCYDQSRQKLALHIVCPQRRQTLKLGLAQLGLVFTLSKAPPGAMEDELEKYLQGLEAR